MVAYLTLCLISIFTGYSLIRLLKINLPTTFCIYLSPIFTLIFWVLGLAWGVLLGHPVKDLWIGGWCATILLTVIGIILFLKQNKDIHSVYFIKILVFITVIALPVLVMRPYFTAGLDLYGGPFAPDGWAYIATGQYLWENARNALGPHVPLHQFASAVAEGRFISFALLGFLSPFMGVKGDTQLSSNLFIAWTLFNFSSACAFFALAYRIKRILVYLTLTLFSSWILLFLANNNFDNALILPFLPFFAGLIELKKIKKIKHIAFIFSLFCAAVIYCYIELAPIIILTCLILAIVGHKNSKDNLYLSLRFLFYSVILTLPFLSNAYRYFYSQCNASFQTQVERPGEYYYPFLLKFKAFFSGFWGIHSNILGLVLGCVLFILAYLGLRKLWDKKNINLISVCLLLVAGALEMILKERYGYGAYKFILLNWWLLAFCVALGINYLLDQHYRAKNLLLPLMAILGFIYVGNVYQLQTTLDHQVPIHDISSHRKLQQIKSIVANKGVRVTVADDVDNEWAVYYLRDVSIQLELFRLYMVGPRIYQSRFAEEETIEYWLTDSRYSLSWQYLIDSYGPYYLWLLPKTPLKPLSYCAI